MIPTNSDICIFFKLLNEYYLISFKMYGRMKMVI